MTLFQKNPAGSGYSKGPRKLPDPERPPQPGSSVAFLLSRAPSPVQSYQKYIFFVFLTIM
jgi:hypothetical protein